VHSRSHGQSLQRCKPTFSKNNASSKSLKNLFGPGLLLTEIHLVFTHEAQARRLRGTSGFAPHWCGIRIGKRGLQRALPSISAKRSLT
jgi:hypothetical protein